MNKTKLFLFVAFLAMGARTVAMGLGVCFSTSPTSNSGVSSPVHKQRKKELVVLWPQAASFVTQCECVEQSIQELNTYMNSFNDPVRAEGALKYTFLVAESEPMRCEHTEGNEVFKATFLFELGRKFQQVRCMLQYEQLVAQTDDLKKFVASVSLEVDKRKIDTNVLGIMMQCLGVLDAELVTLRKSLVFKKYVA